MNSTDGSSARASDLPPPQLPLVTCRLRFISLQNAVFPGYTGSIWRGQFGAQLRRLTCMTGAHHCNGCPVIQRCAYAYLFETPPTENAQRMRKYGTVPHPLVLSPPATMERQEFPAGSEFILSLHVFGHACAMLPIILRTLAMVGIQGLGRDRFPMQLVSLVSRQFIEKDQDIPYHDGMEIGFEPIIEIPPKSPSTPIKIVLQTPLRMVTAGRIANEQRFKFRGFFSSLLRRISMLTVFHTDQPLETDFSGLVQLAGAVSADKQTLRWQEWRRYSSRQGRRVPMGGVTGSFSIDITDAELLWPYLWLGQWTHVAKGTIMGLGKYQIVGSDTLTVDL